MAMHTKTVENSVPGRARVVVRGSICPRDEPHLSAPVIFSHYQAPGHKTLDCTLMTLMTLITGTRDLPVCPRSEKYLWRVERRAVMIEQLIM